jgi:hypothetical protein
MVLSPVWIADDQKIQKELYFVKYFFKNFRTAGKIKGLTASARFRRNPMYFFEEIRLCR